MSAGPREQTTGLEAAIEAAWVELERQAGAAGGGFVDRCGIVDTGVDMADLVVAVVAGLGLTEEWGFGDPDDTEPESWFSGDQRSPDPEAQAIQAANGRALFQRWVSGWSVADGEPT